MYSPGLKFLSFHDDRLHCLTYQNVFAFSHSGTRKLYEDLREKLSNLSRTIKNLETRASKPNFSTDELAYHVSIDCFSNVFKICPLTHVTCLMCLIPHAQLLY